MKNSVKLGTSKSITKWPRIMCGKTSENRLNLGIYWKINSIAVQLCKTEIDCNQFEEKPLRKKKIRANKNPETFPFNIGKTNKHWAWRIGSSSMKVPVPWNAPSPIEEAIATTGLVGGAGGGGVLDLVIGSGPFLSIIYNFFCTFFLIRRRVRTGWIRMDPFDVDGIGDGSQGRRLLTFIDARRRLPSNRLVCVCVCPPLPTLPLTVSFLPPGFQSFQPSSTQFPSITAPKWGDFVHIWFPGNDHGSNWRHPSAQVVLCN